MVANSQQADRAAMLLAVVGAARGEGFCDLSAVRSGAPVSEQLRVLARLLGWKEGLTASSK